MSGATDPFLASRRNGLGCCLAGGLLLSRPTAPALTPPPATTLPPGEKPWRVRSATKRILERVPQSAMDLAAVKRLIAHKDKGVQDDAIDVLSFFDEATINYIRRNYGMLIGEPTAEVIKKSIGSAFPGSEVKEMEVKGRNLSEGVPRSFTISSNEVLEALTDPLNNIVSAVKNALEQTPPELGADIAERGMMLTGGGALLRDLDRLLAEETGLPVLVAEDPLTCVVRGCGIALERMDRLGSIFTSE